jgi:hypothetical protein
MKRVLLMVTGFFLVLGLFFMAGCKKDKDGGDENVADHEPPAISILSPTTNISYLSAEGTITISGIATDNSSISKVEWKMNQGSFAATTGTTDWEVTDVQLENGDNVFTFVAFDGANNTDSTSLVVTYNEYISFLGSPVIDPSGFFINSSTQVNIRISILKNDNIVANSVKLIEVDKKGNEIQELCELYDDGDLTTHGDDIQSDGVYSNIQTFMEATSSNIYLRVKATSTETEGNVDAFSEIGTIYVVDEIPQAVVDDIMATQEDADDKFQEYSATMSNTEAVNQTVEYLKTQDYVVDATVTESGDIWIVFEYGLTGMIITSEEGTEGGFFDVPVRGTKARIPLSQQTRGKTAGSGLKSASATDPNQVMDNDVLLFAPNYTQFHSWGTEFLDNVNDILEDSDCPNFDVTYAKNEAANLEVLRNLTQYGLIVIHTHGGVDKNKNVIFLSGEEVDYTSLDIIDWLVGRIFPATHLGKSIWAIRPSYIDAYNNGYPHTIVYNGSCESGYNKTLANVFLNKGANTYFGFSETVKSVFDRDMANQLFPELITNNKTTGEAFVPNQHDASVPPAYFVMYGNNETYFSGQLTNGDFEEGNLTGWATDGDGRVITQLGFIIPNAGSYMGIISTGLGYTTQTGSLSQNICVPEDASNLIVSWDFLSEEFLEFVGSIFQDYFEIAIVDSSGTENVIFRKAIDDINDEYSLTEVSPEIVFDQGGVYHTGWLFFSYNMWEYAGTSITLIFRAGDVGDSIYDTAILLDEIEIN